MTATHPAGAELIDAATAADGANEAWVFSSSLLECGVMWLDRS